MSMNSDRLRLEIQRARGPFILLTLVMIGGIVATLMMLNKLNFERPWESYRTVRAEFTDVKAIQPGKQDVRIAGVDVGVVRDWKLEDGRAVLELAIEEKYGEIFNDARVRIRPVTPLQDMYVQLERGTRAAGVLPDGGRIRVARTVSPVDISRVLNIFDRDTRTELGHLLRGMGAGLDDEGASLKESFVALAPFLRSAADMTRALAGRRRALARLVHNFGGVSEALAHRDRQLAQLVSSGNTTLGELARRDVALSATVAELPRTVAAMQTSLARLSRAEDELDPALRALGPVASELEPGLRALERFSVKADPALRALTPSVQDLRPLVASLASTVESGQTAVERLRPQAEQLDTMTRLVMHCATPIHNFFRWTPSILKFGDANGANPRAEVSVGTASTPAAKLDPSLKRQPKCYDDFQQEDAG